jgi:hypothetical protein
MNKSDVEKRLDAALAAVRGRTDTEESSRHMLPQRETRLRYDSEANPDWNSRERCAKRDQATHDWSGKSWGGVNWSGGRQR